MADSQGNLTCNFEGSHYVFSRTQLEECRIWRDFGFPLRNTRTVSWTTAG
ncbi:hypothetical protein SOVF_123190 isoform A [Spinacia oleracea]|nr:hypothetical protein SOVF_123190 isoform A [Spinacia oleracea]